MDNITAALREALEKGSSFDEAIKEIMGELAKEAFPDCRCQRCFVHLARNVSDFARPCDKQSAMAGFMALAKMGSMGEAESGLEAFAAEWGGEIPEGREMGGFAQQGRRILLLRLQARGQIPHLHKQQDRGLQLRDKKSLAETHTVGE